MKQLFFFLSFTTKSIKIYNTHKQISFYMYNITAKKYTWTVPEFGNHP